MPVLWPYAWWRCQDLPVLCPCRMYFTCSLVENCQFCAQVQFILHVVSSKLASFMTTYLIYYFSRHASFEPMCLSLFKACQFWTHVSESFQGMLVMSMSWIFSRPVSFVPTYLTGRLIQICFVPIYFIRNLKACHMCDLMPVKKVCYAVSRCLKPASFMYTD